MFAQESPMPHEISYCATDVFGTETKGSTKAAVNMNLSEISGRLKRV